MYIVRATPGDAGKLLPTSVCNLSQAWVLSVSLQVDPKSLLCSSLRLDSIEMPLQNFKRRQTDIASAAPHGDLVALSRSPDSPVELQSSVIVVDERDHEGVHIAASNLAEDFARVTKGSPRPIVRSDDARIDVAGSIAVVVGCIESSPLMRKLESNGKVNFRGIRGKWESFQTSLVHKPFDGCAWALVIAGSDKRGAIYGAYTLSEQIGVSP